MKTKFESITELSTISSQLDVAEEKDVWTTEKDSVALAEKTNSYKGIWNKTTNKLACIGTSRYKIIQHSEAFGQLCEVLQDLGINAKGSVVNQRDKVHAEILFGEMIKDDSSKGIQMGVRITNSYDMSNSLRGELFAFRLVCSNGMVLGQATGIKFRRLHMGKVDARKEMVSFLKKAIEGNVRMKKLVDDALAETLEWDLAKRILAKMITTKKYRSIIEDELKDKPNPSRWDIYNAITNLATHGESLTDHAKDFLQRQAQRILVCIPED